MTDKRMKIMKDVSNLIMSIEPVDRLPIIMTCLDYTLPELDMTIEEILELRDGVIKICGEVE